MSIDKDILRELFKHHCKEVPSCTDSLYQSDVFVEHALEILDYICLELGVYDDEEQ